MNMGIFSVIHRIIQKIKREGLLDGSLRIMIYIKRELVKILKAMRWIFPFLSINLNNKKKKKRLLAIWDMQDVPYSIGDLLYLNQAMLCLATEKKIKKIDICFICDPKNPYREDYDGLVDPKNFRLYLNSLIPVIQFNQRIGSFFVFDSYDQANCFFSTMIDYFYLWPSGMKYLGKGRAYSQNFQTITRFYATYQFIPYLECPAHLKTWAIQFLTDHTHGAFPVVIQIRGNDEFSPDRNSITDAWEGFISQFIDNHDIVFFIVGLKREIPAYFSLLPNVVIIKDHGTTLDQDLAIISVSPFYMGVPSGPAAMAYLSKKPYILFNYKTSNENILPGSQFPFASDNQKLIWEPETKESLTQEFLECYTKIDLNIWKNQVKTNENSRESICL